MTNKGIFQLLRYPSISKKCKMGSWITSSKFLTSERLFWKKKFVLKIQAVNNTRIVSQRKREIEFRRTVGIGQKRTFGATRGRVGDSENTHNSQPLISGFNCVLMSKCYPALLLLISHKLFIFPEFTYSFGFFLNLQPWAVIAQVYVSLSLWDLIALRSMIIVYMSISLKVSVMLSCTRC